MGVYLQGIYLVEIAYDHWWQYIPFHSKTVYGKERTLSLIQSLNKKGYAVKVSESAFFSKDFSYQWIIPAPSLLEKKVEG